MKGKKASIIYGIFLICTLLWFGYDNIFYKPRCEKNRYAFDFGSGSIKVKSAVVDVCTNKITQVLAVSNKHTKFEKCIVTDKAGHHIIAQECIEHAKTSFSEIEKELGVTCKKDKCSGIATAWARKTKNADEIIDLFNQLGVNLKTVSQEEEGVISYYSVLEDKELRGIDKKDVVVWDIGGASFQMTTLDDNGKIYVYHGPYGVFSFEKEIYEFYNVRPAVETPYLSGDLLKRSLEYASENIGKKLSNDPVIGKKLKSATTKVFAIGGPMSKGFKEQMYMPATIGKKEMEKIAYELQYKTLDDTQSIYPLLPKAYTGAVQAAAILVYGVLNGAGIDRVHIIDAMVTDYLLVADDYYQSGY